MTTVSINEAQSRLFDLIRQLSPGEEVVITENDRPIARLVSTGTPAMQRKLGTMRGTVSYISPDFDAPLDDFKEYMQ